ncbi:MAG: hypothetical protein MRJ93_07240 [Nitrososphaeraceae archaeon]|nr:hypothetical protein [Nitrososphaeraceae archaeon]
MVHIQDFSLAISIIQMHFLDIAKQQDPNIVHSTEHGLYGLFIDPLVPNKIASTIDKLILCAKYQ